MEESIANTHTKIKEAFDLYQHMYKERLILAYQGDVSQDLTKAFSALAQDSMEKEAENEKVKKQVFHVVIESLQNLSKHSYNTETGESSNPGSGLILLARLDDCYLLTTGNAILKDKAVELKEMLEKINNMTLDEVKQLYKTVLRESRLSDKGGAGLGFIDMVKKTKSKIPYEFIPLNDVVDFFIYQVIIKKDQ